MGEPGSPLRPILCLKRRDKLKEVEEKEECFILDFGPDEYHTNNNNLHTAFASDVSFIAENGEVACRDFPHPRHVCVKYPFEKTDHEKYCEMCYCHICDVPAPCNRWTSHCHAKAAEAPLFVF